jgi:hypothetical protein
MQSTLPGPCEMIVSSVHGNGAFSDAQYPITIGCLSQGAVLSPAPKEVSSILSERSEQEVIIGKVHYILPTLRNPEEETINGKLTGYAIVSTALEIRISPYREDTDKNKISPLHGASKIVQVDLYAGRDLLGSWKRGDGRQNLELPADSDFQIHIESVIYGEAENRFNEKPSGLGVTLTIEFHGKMSLLLISSIALVQTIGSRGIN